MNIHDFLRRGVLERQNLCFHLCISDALYCTLTLFYFLKVYIITLYFPAHDLLHSLFVPCPLFMTLRCDDHVGLASCWRWSMWQHVSREIMKPLGNFAHIEPRSGRPPEHPSPPWCEAFSTSFIVFCWLLWKKKWQNLHETCILVENKSNLWSAVTHCLLLCASWPGEITDFVTGDWLWGWVEMRQTIFRWKGQIGHGCGFKSSF